MISNNFLYLNNEIVTTFSNISYILIFMFAGVFYLHNIQKIRKQKAEEQEKEIDMYKEQLRKEKRSMSTGPLSDYLNLLENYFTKKNIKKPYSYVQFTIGFTILFSILIGIYVTTSIGVISFFVINLLLSVLLKNLEENKSSESEYKLPEVIDTIVRCFSKSDELQVVIYESSLTIEEPFKKLFSDMAREMTSSGHLYVLNKYSKKTNSVWISSLFSILIKYKEDAKKEDTLTNLKHLRDMISQENDLKRKLVSDKRYSVALNYILSGLGVVGNIGIFIFVPEIAKKAYLSNPFGMLMLVAGYGSVIAVLLLTKKLGNKNNLKVEE